jgi:hypothetical protein
MNEVFFNINDKCSVCGNDGWFKLVHEWAYEGVMTDLDLCNNCVGDMIELFNRGREDNEKIEIGII